MDRGPNWGRQIDAFVESALTREWVGPSPIRTPQSTANWPQARLRIHLPLTGISMINVGKSGRFQEVISFNGLFHCGNQGVRRSEFVRIDVLGLAETVGD